MYYDINIDLARRPQFQDAVRMIDAVGDGHGHGHDAAAAGELVCREALDQEKLNARVNLVKGWANEYDGPTFRWDDPAVSGQSDERATVSVRLTLTTDDEKTAQQQLTFTTVRKTGWLVCDVTG